MAGAAQAGITRPSAAFGTLSTCTRLSGWAEHAAEALRFASHGIVSCRTVVLMPSERNEAIAASTVACDTSSESSH